MEYALCYEFDENSAQYLNHLIDEVAKVTGNTIMIDNKIPAHITVGCFETESEELLIEMVESALKSIVSQQIYVGVVGTFKPNVLFVAPQLNQFLQESCECFFDYLHEIATPGDHGYYQPYKWMPHIAINITETKAKEGLLKLVELFDARRVTCEKLTIVKCDPYTVIKTYELKKIN
ncbi:hypothetical protein [Anaerorhabdus sp.]|uniref:hypothetical protein n=1 Tax=Anaerorhabdus sp. TaxID=1872524 RepID=UPI002FCC987F